MVNDDQADHSGDTDVNEIAEREVVVRLKVFDYEGYELEVQEINQNTLQQIQLVQIAAFISVTKNVDGFFPQKNDKNEGQEDQGNVQNPL
jgi:hypothetical protein